MVVFLVMQISPRRAMAEVDAQTLLGRLGVVARMHRTLDRYQRMRAALYATDDDLRVDALTMGLLHSHGGVRARQRLNLNQTGHVIGVDRIAGDWGLALFRSSATDMAYTEDELGAVIDRRGVKFTVMGGQAWYRDLIAVAVGHIGDANPQGDGPPVAIPADLDPATSPLFLRVDVPRYGAWGRMDLLGAQTVGDAAFGFDSGPLFERWALELDGRRFGNDAAWWTRARGVWRPHRVAQVTALVGMDVTDRALNQAGAGMRLSHRVGVMIDVEGTFEFGAARIQADLADPTPSWEPAFGTQIHVWLNHEHFSAGFEVGGAINWPHSETLSPVYSGSNSAYLGGHVRIGI
ncbi:MAG: hypothetical protein H6702_22520 [Myxococcales bacterium]|nr:hypothetical protein [Myxococcales bacterium]